MFQIYPGKNFSRWQKMKLIKSAVSGKITGKDDSYLGSVWHV